MEVLVMTGSGRLRLLVRSCFLAAVALVFTGERAWAKVHQTEAHCLRPATGATATGFQSARDSWRAYTLRAGGCEAFRHVHNRMHNRVHNRMHRRRS
jgi:hypothetical protein